MYPPSQSFKSYNDNSSDEASIHGEEEAFLEKPTKPSNKGRYHRTTQYLRYFCCNYNPSVLSCVLSALTAGLLILALFLIASVSLTSSGLQQLQTSLLPLNPPLHENSAKPAGNLQHMHCGSTPNEARALGCVFDIMSFAWTPPACFDQAISEETARRTGPWIFYLDHEATKPIPFDNLNNELIVWTEHSYHVSHCLYAWERIHRGYLNKKILPSEVAGLNHSLHCRDLLNDPKTTDKKIVNAIAYMVFDSCTNLNA